MSTKHRINLLGALLILGAALWGYLYHADTLEPFDRKRTDLMFRLRGPEPADNRIVIVDIDERSLAKLGQWPWPRWKMAKILKNLSADGAALVALDIVYSEPDNTSPRRLFEAYGIRGPRHAPDHDAMLADAIARVPTVLGYFFDFESPRPAKAVAPPTVSAIFIERDRPPKGGFLLEPKGVVPNIPVIRQAALTSGFVNTLPDADGIVRSVPLVVRYEGMPCPALSFETVRTLLGARRVFLNYSPAGLAEIRMDGLAIPTDRFGRLLIDYRGPKRSYRYVSAADVFEGRFAPGTFRGRVVLVGTSAAGLVDLRATPFDNAFPGVEIHATLVDNLLNGEFLARPDWIESFDIAVMAALTLMMWLLFAFTSPLFSGVASLGLLAAFYVFAYQMLFSRHILVNTIFPTLLLLALFALFMIVSYLFEYRTREMLREKFAKKVSPRVVEELLRHPADAFETRQKEVTIFFSDIRHFTRISEKLGDPKAIVEMLNAYMTPMADIILASQGTLDKYIGDAIMAYWNAPAPVAQHADRAVRAALAQLEALKEVNEAFAQKGWPKISIGIGIHTGEVIVGEMGSRGRSDYTVTGDNVNLASRIEGLNKYYGTRLLISRATREKLQGGYTLREVDTVRVKGRRRPITLFEVLGRGAPSPRLAEELARHAEALERYRRGDFKGAHALFVALEADHPCRLYEIFLARTREWSRRPPADFDGIHTFEEKF